MTIYRKVECPHCGNEINVNSDVYHKKCRWCKRLVQVEFEGKGKKAKCNVEAIDFPDEKEYKDNNKNNKKEKKMKRKPNRGNIKPYSEWKDEDVYGRTKK